MGVLPPAVTGKMVATVFFLFETTSSSPVTCVCSANVIKIVPRHCWSLRMWRCETRTSLTTSTSSSGGDVQ
uniref:Putative secreted protein n=1 Tax=Anopheles darlingi TaxID=43151 RepID=A0A2M4D934_ANODA